MTAEQKSRMAEAVLPAMRGLLAHPKLRDLVESVSVVGLSDGELLVDDAGFYTETRRYGIFSPPHGVKRERREPDAALAEQFRLVPWQVEAVVRRLEA